jgi:hypothetical protein
VKKAKAKMQKEQGSNMKRANVTTREKWKELQQC